MGLVVAIHQPHYLPYLGFFDKMQRADLFVYLDHVAFTPGWQNRNYIKTSTGRTRLTVPVARRSRGGPIRGASIAQGADWQRRHEATVRQGYARAPHLDMCAELLGLLYHHPWTNLGMLNLACDLHLTRMLGITTPWVLSSSLGEFSQTKTALLAEICRRLGAATYLAGDGCASYLDPGVMEMAGIELRWQGYRPPRYPQLHEGFVDNLSVLDLLMNAGPEAGRILTSEEPA